MIVERFILSKTKKLASWIIVMNLFLIFLDPVKQKIKYIP